ncbi:hypothetical protein [Zoogloea sp.]|uniref:hypothetical protein n=1 Tax=Zoogloea sp. TaxID=49181 RepID=UPI001416C4DF|nr:MAG: hypothetical protein F9K15_20680 [Zoogloea sp.]
MNISLFKKSALALAAFGVLASAPARADNLVISPDVAAPSFTVNVSGSSKDVLATLFSVNDQTTGTSFLAFCFELLQNMNAGAYVPPGLPYSAGSTVSAATQALFDQSYASLDLTNRSQVAGFQIALWETLDDSNRSTGAYTNWLGDTGSAVEANALAVADDLLTKVRSGAPGTANYQLITWNNSTSQDLIQAVPGGNKVPEPATALLGALSLGGVVALRRRWN